MASSNELCIFTPTYNRAYCLSDLFDSLCRQTTMQFEWLIVDDGSTDNTQELVSNFQAKGQFPITYIKQANGGKQRAFNTGVQYCKSELFMCVDSDDTVPVDMVATILNKWGEVHDDPTIAGVIGMDGKDVATPLQTSFPKGLQFTTMWDLYYKHHHKGDVAVAHRIEILKQYPFDVAPNEKFIAETYVFHQIDQHYKLAVIPKILIIANYRADGYSANVRKVTRENPIGYMKLKRMYIEYAETWRLRFYETILYMVGCHFAQQSGAISNAPYRFLAAAAWLPAQILCHTVYRPK